MKLRISYKSDGIIFRELNQMDLKIENAEKLNKKIMNKIDEKIETYNNHKATLVGSEQRLNDIENEIENQRNVFKERAEINKLKFEELEKKYNNLEKKIMDLQMKLITKFYTFINLFYYNQNYGVNLNHIEKVIRYLKVIIMNEV